MPEFIAYRCLDCGYIHDKDKSYPHLNIKAGTPFDKLPKDWGCPVCRKGKDMFIPVK